MWNRWLDSNASHVRPLALCLGVYASFALAAVALYSLVDSPGPMMLSLVLVAVGMTVGYALRSALQRRGMALLLGAIVALPIFFSSFSIEGVPEDARVAFVLVALVIFLSFGAGTNHAVLFLMAPALAILIAGLTENANDEVTACALGFCLTSVFVLLCFASLRRPPPREFRMTLRQTLRDRITLSGLNFMLASVLALVIMAPLRIGGNLLRPLVTGSPLAVGRSHVAAAPVTPSAFGAVSAEQLTVGQGPLPDTHSPVMRVRGGRGAYYLTRIYTDYDIAGWKETPELETPEVTRFGNGLDIRPDLYAEHWPVLEQRVALLTQMLMAPACFEVSRIRLDGSGPMLDADTHGCVRIPGGSARALSYTAESHVAPPLDAMTDGPADLPQPPAPSVPMGIPDEVSQLASQLRGKTDVATVKNIIQYLQAHCTYDLNAPAVPAGEDAVDFFLFSTRAGYCDLFATSGALLAQIDGIPARYCIGYIPGEATDDSMQLVTTDQAHAWIQVFIQGRGWISADPTPPGFTGPPSFSVKLRSYFYGLHIHLPNLDFPTILAIGTGLLGLILLYGSLPLAARRRLAKELAESGRKQQALLDYAWMEHHLQRLGVARAPYETPDEYRGRVRSWGIPPLAGAVDRLTARLIEALYKGREPADDAGASLAALISALKIPEVRKALAKIKDLAAEEL